MQIENGSAGKCYVISNDYSFQGATVERYQCDILQAAWTLSAHIQDDGTQTHSDSDYDKALMLTYLASQQDCLRFNATLYGFWNSHSLFRYFCNTASGHVLYSPLLSCKAKRGAALARRGLWWNNQKQRQAKWWWNNRHNAEKSLMGLYWDSVSSRRQQQLVQWKVVR